MRDSILSIEDYLNDLLSGADLKRFSTADVGEAVRLIENDLPSGCDDRTKWKVILVDAAQKAAAKLDRHDDRWLIECMYEITA